MPEHADIVAESSSTTGTGTYTLGGALDGYRPFSGNVTDGATVRCIVVLADEREVVEGIFTVSGNTLTRATILASTNGGAAVNWGAGVKAVGLVLTAGEIDGFGLTNFTEALNTAAPNATVPVVSLTATNAAVNVDVALSPKGTGAITAHVADNLATGGNKRGSNAIDLQTSRTAATQVASGAGAVAVGARNTVSGSQSSAIGYANTASGPYSSAFGWTNIASGGWGATASGYKNTASGNYAAAFGYKNTAGTADNCSAIGTWNYATGIDSSAVGYNNSASGTNYACAFGSENTASGSFASAFGYNNSVTVNSASAFGNGNTASGIGASAFGRVTTAGGSKSSAFGYRAKTTIANTQEFGYWSSATVRGAAIRLHGTGYAAISALATDTALTDGGVTKGSEADGTLMRGAYAVRMSVAGAPVIDYNTSAGAVTSHTLLDTADIGTTVQAYDVDTAKYDAVTANFTGTLQNGGSNVVVDTDIGVTIQGYDVDTAKLDVVQSFTAQQTFKEYAETQYSLTGTVIDPANGSLQYKTLSSNTTFTESLVDGQSVTLMIDDGTAYTITWPTTTWVGGAAPTLPTTGYAVIELWQINAVLYGIQSGDA